MLNSSPSTLVPRYQRGLDLTKIPEKALAAENFELRQKLEQSLPPYKKREKSRK